MRMLYFDIDGSLLIGDTGEPKPALANGSFERAVRRSGIEHLVCVGTFVDVCHVAKEVDPHYDVHDALLKVCRGVFFDEEWFRANTSLVSESLYRAVEVDLDSDWWFLDDFAQYYFQVADREDVFEQNIGGRILVPDAGGSGEDVLEWLDSI